MASPLTLSHRGWFGSAFGFVVIAASPYPPVRPSLVPPTTPRHHPFSTSSSHIIFYRALFSFPSHFRCAEPETPPTLFIAATRRRVNRGLGPTRSRRNACLCCRPPKIRRIFLRRECQILRYYNNKP